MRYNLLSALKYNLAILYYFNNLSQNKHNMCYYALFIPIGVVIDYFESKQSARVNTSSEAKILLLLHVFFIVFVLLFCSWYNWNQCIRYMLFNIILLVTTCVVMMYGFIYDSLIENTIRIINIDYIVMFFGFVYMTADAKKTLYINKSL